MNKIAIIGAGIQGITIFLNLPRALQDRTILIDKYSHPAALFFKRCTAVGMRYLRSPGSHALFDPPSHDLYKYSQSFGNPIKDFEGSSYTPSVKIFKDYIRHHIQSVRHFDFIQAEILDMDFISEEGGYWDIIASTQTFQAQFVILALGSEYPHIPDIFNGRLSLSQHVLSTTYKNPSKDKRKRIAVIGGGMSGTQAALSLSNHHDVSLIIRNKIKQKPYDSNPGFIGKKHRGSYINLSPDKKLAVLEKARYRGTVNSYIYEKLETHYLNKKLNIFTERLTDFTHNLDDTYTLHFRDFEDITVDEIVLATGLQACSEIIEHSKLLTQLIYKYRLPLTSQNTPLLKKDSFEWYSQLLVSGVLAELTIGPFAGNIIGAQMFSRMMKPTFDIIN